MTQNDSTNVFMLSCFIFVLWS